MGVPAAGFRQAQFACRLGEQEFQKIISFEKLCFLLAVEHRDFFHGLDKVFPVLAVDFSLGVGKNLSGRSANVPPAGKDVSPCIGCAKFIAGDEFDSCRQQFSDSPLGYDAVNRACAFAEFFGKGPYARPLLEHIKNHRCLARAYYGMAVEENLLFVIFFAIDDYASDGFGRSGELGGDFSYYCGSAQSLIAGDLRCPFDNFVFQVQWSNAEAGSLFDERRICLYEFIDLRFGEAGFQIAVCKDIFFSEESSLLPSLDGPD